MQQIVQTLGEGGQIIAQAADFVRQNAPEPPLDPGAAAVKAQQMETERLTKRDQMDMQLETAQIQQKAQTEAAKIQAQAAMNSQDNQTNIQVALIKESGKTNSGEQP
jgi:hypothetical protein